MIESMVRLSRKLKEVFPDRYITIQCHVCQFKCSEELEWYLYIEDLFNDDFSTPEDLQKKAYHLIYLHDVGIYGEIEEEIKHKPLPYWDRGALN